MTLIKHWLGSFAIVCTTKVRDETFRNKYGGTFFLKDFACGNKRFRVNLWGMLNMGTNDQIMQGRWKVSHMHFPVIWTLQFWEFSLAMVEDTTAKKMKFFFKEFFSKCGQIRSFLRIWSHLLKKSLMEKFIFCAVLFTECFTQSHCWKERLS